MYHLTGNDTICAVSTPPGLGAISVNRLSGPEAVEISKKIFHPKNKDVDIARVSSHTIHAGTIGDSGEILDEVLLSIFRAPHSYTGKM